MIKNVNQEKASLISMMSRPDDVNDLQWEAVQFLGGHLLIVAGPGTGKTHTLVYRCFYLAQKLKQSEKFLAITFTQKASEELKERLGNLDQALLSRCFVGTFHGFCANVLRKYADRSNLPQDFKVLTPEEIVEKMREVWSGLKQREIKDRLEDIFRLKSKDVNRQVDKEVEAYNVILRQNQALDYDDLLIETINLLENCPDILAEQQKEFRWILVDEYQDINDIQQKLLKLMVGKQNVVTAIGDPQQAIYGFRGSRVDFFNGFEQDFPGAQRVYLRENYRSASNLIEAAAQVMEGQEQVFVEKLVARMVESGELLFHCASSEKAEAEFIVHQIERLIGGASMFSRDSRRVVDSNGLEYSFGDVAVLYRLNALRPALEKALDRSGIPFQVGGEKIDPVDEAIDLKAEKVSLMTLHAAKGLEFPIVFIMGCEDGILPLNWDGRKVDISEERRLFYVGMTRAKQSLYLTRSTRRMLYGKTYNNQTSPFIEDIDNSLKTVIQEKLAKKNKPDIEIKQLNLFRI